MPPVDFAGSGGRWHTRNHCRCCWQVPLEHDDSNFKACDEVFFSKVGIPRERIYTVDPALTAEEAAAAYTTQLKGVFGEETVPSFDLVLLGMGPDGHTASLFPGHPLLEVRRVTTHSPSLTAGTPQPQAKA